MDPIDSFMREYRFLSNFWPAEVSHDGILYPTVEHAFQAAKTLDFNVRWGISQLKTPGKAKRAGRRLALRPDWEQAKERIMMELVVSKIVGHPELLQKLLATGSRRLIEGNTWGDTYWGICNGKGQNKLGTILMLIRDRFSSC